MTRKLEIHCDGTFRGEWCRVYLPTTVLTVDDDLAANGWVVDDQGRDLCPRCGAEILSG